MTQDLFIDPTLSFEKVASEVALPEDPNAWPNEILQELFKQVPYISDFEPHVVMDRVDAERGYAFGHVEVMNKTEIQRGMDPQGLASAGIKQARIPIVVRDRKLMPFDVLVTENSRVVPLTEHRLRSAVFRPQAFDVTSLTPGDQSMIGQLYPPFRQNYGFGGGGSMMSAGMGKSASSRAPLLESILPTIEVDTYSQLNEKLASEQLQAAFVSNAEATAYPLGLLSRYEPIDPVKVATSIFGSVPCDVVQLTKTATGYQVKAANHAFWAPVHHVFDRGQAVKSFGEKVVLAADMNGTVTMAEGAETETPEEADASMEIVHEFGVYKVQDEKGRELIGFVFPQLVDIDGKEIPMMLFSNGSQAALQGEIAGSPVSTEIVGLTEGHPRGYGCFYGHTADGMQATIPMEIHASLDDGSGVALKAHTFQGQDIEVRIQPNIQRVEAVEGSMLIPADMRWLPLDDAETVTLAGNADEEKQASPTRFFSTITLRSGGEDSFSVNGFPVEKLAYEEKNMLSFDDTAFLLAGLGVEPKHAMQKMAEAYGHSEPTEVKCGRMLKTAQEQIALEEKKASGLRGLVHKLRVDLLKEAAVIPDPVAVDTVLSLGFINPENLGTFIGYLPLIDEAQSRMCELLIASRVGMRDVPTSALEKAIRSTEDVLEGLKVLAFQRN